MMVTPGPMFTVVVPTLFTESVTLTTSCTEGSGPAVYAPVPATMDPPELLVWRDQVNPVPEPPVAVNAWLARGATVGLAGAMVEPAVTETLAVRALPSES